MLIKTSTFLIVLIALNGCGSIRKPCAEGGDTSWIPEIKGDKFCNQKKQKDGTYLNHGDYRVKHPNGKTAIEGQFEEGKKTGYWWQYNEKGEKTVEKYFDKGVEKMAPSSQAPPTPTPSGRPR